MENQRRNPGSKVIAVAAGEAHTLSLSGDGKVYSWGRGAFGRLGTGSDSDENLPVPVKFDDNDDNNKPQNIVGVASGAYHSLALADDGSVWCWGYNTYGQLGFDGENVSVPRQMDKLIELDSPQSLGNDSEGKTKTPLKISSIKASGMMSLAIDDLGGLWIWGNCPQPSSSTNDTFSLSSISTPVPVWDFDGHTVVKVACGNEHVVALVSAGETYKGDDLVCYTWGNNNHGQLGLGDTESRLQPQVVSIFSDRSMWSAYEVACGAFHTVVLTLKKGPTDTLESVCWTFGLGENGQLGHGTSQSALVPEPIEELPRNTFLVSVDCGLFHTSVVSSAGEVWSWGMERGLGLCPNASFSGADHGDALSPLLIRCNGPYPYGPKFPGPVQVACGAAHTIIVADDGYKLWSWGRGRSGVLGHGKGEDSYSPILVLWPPLSEDFADELHPSRSGSEHKRPETRDSEGEVEKKLSLAIEEMKVLQSKLSTTERYASILHGAIFGRPFEEGDIPSSLYGPGNFDIAKEWENMLDSADRGKLTRLEMFYKSMLAGVKDKLLKRRVQEIVQECLQSSSATRRV